MEDLAALRSLAKAMGVSTRYTDGLGRKVVVGPETLVRVCAALGAPIAGADDAADAMKAWRAARRGRLAPDVLVAWDGDLAPVTVGATGSIQAELQLENGEKAPLEVTGTMVATPERLPMGYHRLTLGASGRSTNSWVISAPVQAWRRQGEHRSWGVGVQLAALRSSRSRSVGDIHDLDQLCRWVADKGGDLVTVLPLLPTFNEPPAEPSPYSPVSRLFWSELILDLGDKNRPTPPPSQLDVTRAMAEVQAALAGEPVPDALLEDEELVRYARFRGAQAKHGRNWRAWPVAARSGRLSPNDIDPDVARFHLLAQKKVRQQLHDLRWYLGERGLRLGLDLAVGVHPDGYDPWSRQHLFAEGMSVGAPPDFGFPSGQDWGFSPVHPAASAQEAHRYIAASIAHQAELAGLLRIDHIMAWTRLYWIPHGFTLDQGTYVSYPAEELFAILTLESHRGQCEIVGENLGTVPPEIGEALPKHRIWGMYLAQFEAPRGQAIQPPERKDMALIGTHDTPTFAGWIANDDVDERVQHQLLKPEAADGVRQERTKAAHWLAERVGANVEDRKGFLGALLEWLGRADTPVVVPWFEDFWLEQRGVNLPGTRSSARPNWQRPMSRMLDEILGDPDVNALVARLDRARKETR